MNRLILFKNLVKLVLFLVVLSFIYLFWLLFSLYAQILYGPKSAVYKQQMKIT